MAQQQSIDHHFVPQFYLKRWAGPDEKVCEFTRPYKKLVVRSKTPETTGFQKHLYTVPGLPPDKRSVLEDVVLKQIDQIASDALDFMIGNPTGEREMHNKLRSGWSRFLMSLMHRSPEKLAALKAKALDYLTEQLPRLSFSYATFKEPSDPEDFEEMAELLRRDMTEKTWAKLFEGMIDNPEVGAFFNQMHWSTATIVNPENHLLTSDHPLIMTNGIKHPDGSVIVPVGPTQVFIAVNSAAVSAEVKDTNPRYLVRTLNDKIATQAVDYVYDTDERQWRFVENRLRRQSS